MEQCEVCSQADEKERPEAVQALLADPYAAEDVVRSAAWPSFCASISALLSGPQPATATAGVTFLEKVLEEARLSDSQSVAELFIALASHLRSTYASSSHSPTAESGPKPAHLPAVKAVPPQAEFGLCSRQGQRALSYGAVTDSSCKGSRLSYQAAANIAVDCRAADKRLQGTSPAERGSATLVSTASHSGVHHLPQLDESARGTTAQEHHAAADQQQAPKSMQQGSAHGDGMAAQHSSPCLPGQVGEARARQFRLLGRMLEALPKIWVCLKPPMMRKLWRSLSALLLVEPQCDSMPPADAAGTAQTELQDRQQHKSEGAGLQSSTHVTAEGLQSSAPAARLAGMRGRLVEHQCGSMPAADAAGAAHTAQDHEQLTVESAGLQSSMHETAGDVHPSALGSCLAGMRGPLVELSLALQLTPLHAKSWWQAWTLPIFSTRV